MGRKSTDKVRINNPGKRLKLAELLIPSLQGKSLAKLTMDEIAEGLGKSKATIYKYFRSREELLDLALTGKLDRIRGFVPLLSQKDVPYVTRYFNAIEHLSTHLDDISTQFLSDLRHEFPAQWSKVEFFQEMAAMVLRAYYQEGLDSGLLNDIHPGILVQSDRILFNSLLDPRFLEANSLTVKEAFQHYFRMKFFGIVKEKNGSPLN